MEIYKSKIARVFNDRLGKSSLFIKSLLVLGMSLSVIGSIRAQCSTGCTTTITSSGGSGNLDLSAGDTLCINATGGDITIDYSRIAMRPGTGLKMCTDASSTIIMNTQLRFFGGGIGTQGEIINQGNFEYTHGALNVSRTKWTNNGLMQFNNDLTIGSASTLINTSGSVINITGDLETTSGSLFISNDGEIVATGDVKLSSADSKLNGVMRAGSLLSLNSSSVIELTNSIFIADQLVLNGGTYNIDPFGCAAFLISNDITIQSGINVVGGGEIDVTDSTEMSSTDVNNCTGCAGLNFTADNTCFSVLPVQLIGFSAAKSDENVVLRWSTGSESDNQYFLVERSQDRILFETIGSVQGNGTTSTLTEYEFLDVFYAGKTSYYRLKQYDFDGDWEYSPVVAYDPNSKVSDLQLYNFGDLVSLDWSDDKMTISFSMINASGKTLMTGEVMKNELLDVSNLKKGLYVIRADFGGFSEAVSLIKH